MRALFSSSTSSDVYILDTSRPIYHDGVERIPARDTIENYLKAIPLVYPSLVSGTRRRNCSEAVDGFAGSKSRVNVVERLS